MAFAVAFSLGAGIAGGVQAAVMGRLGDRVGSMEALAFSTLLAAAIGACVLLLARQTWSGYGAAVRQPLWMLTGGVFGAIIILALTVAVPRLGTTGTIALLITGNLVAAVAIDRFGWLGSDRITLHWYRVLGVVLLAAGAALALKK